ncbi:CG3062, partial [Drosophila busckii]
YERTYRAKSNANWEYPRFSPPRPRSLASNCKPITDNQGHLLPKAPREGHFLGHYRGTYHLPLRITRSFANAYDACLSGRYKYRDFPRDLCCCQWERHKQTKCDWRTTLGKKGDPYWERPKCQEKCEGLQQLLKIEHLHKHCKHQKC